MTPSPSNSQALAGLVAALRGVNAAANAYYAAYGVWPRFGESVARILTTPLDALEVNQLLDVAVLEVMPGDE